MTKVKGIGFILNNETSSSIIKNQGLFKVFDTSSNIIISIQLKKISFLMLLLEFRLCVWIKIKLDYYLDNLDYLYYEFRLPPNEYNSIFIMTNYIETIQTEAECDEVYLLFCLILIYLIDLKIKISIGRNI